MAKKSTTSRFGNPAKAAAANAARPDGSNVVTLSDAIAQRAKAGLLQETVDRVVPAFRSWMTAAGVPSDEVDRLARLFVNYFNNYSASVRSADPTNLDVGLTTKLLEDAARFHPEMRVSVAPAVNSYLKFLVATQAWTGPHDDVLSLLEMTAADVLAPSSLGLAPFVFHDSSNPVEDGTDRASRTCIRWAVALLTRFGEGRILTATGLLGRKDLAGAAACIDEHVVGSARVDYTGPAEGSPRAVTSMANVPRLLAAAASGRPDIAIPFGPERPEEHDEAGRPDPRLDPRFWRDPRLDCALTELVDAGLVEQGAFLVVPPSLRSALAAALDHLGRMMEEAQPGK